MSGESREWGEGRGERAVSSEQCEQRSRQRVAGSEQKAVGSEQRPRSWAVDEVVGSGYLPTNHDGPAHHYAPAVSPSATPTAAPTLTAT